MLNFGEMGGNESVWSSQHCHGEKGDKGMNPMTIQKLSLEAESYVTITRKVFSLCTYILLNSTVAVKHGLYNFRKTNFKDFSRIFQGQITVFKD